MEIKGTNGKLIAYEEYVVISRKNFGGFITQGIKGDRKIYYKDLVAIEYRKPTKMANGYIQFIYNPELAGNQSVGFLGSKLDALKDPNAVILRAFTKRFSEETSKFYEYVYSQYEYYRNKLNGKQGDVYLSNADELRKYKALLDDGIITHSEFEVKKKELLK